MKKLLFISLIILLIPFIGSTNPECDYEIPTNISVIDGSDFEPGSVVCILAGSKDYINLKNFSGTESEPITVINKGGAVIINTSHFYGIKFDNCKHVKLSGTGSSSQEYGFRVLRVEQGAGVSVDNKSTNIEIEFIEVSNTAIGGIYAKTEPYQGDCNNLVTRENFTMYDLSIHDCYLHDIADEGFYIGSSKYTGQTIYAPGTECDNIVVLPHVIEGVSIYNNLVENTGWDGIQVSSATKDCNIYNNIIINDSYAEEVYQMSGILIGGGSKCDCYNNQIFDGKGDGIDVFGMGDMKIFNNLIVNPGRTFKPGDENERKSGIYVGFVPGAISPDATFSLYNNTIISPKSYGITYNNNEASMGYIINNLITNPGNSQDPGEVDYINLMVSESKIDKQNNFLRANNQLPLFVNYSTDNYQLRPNSPAVNYGKSLTSEGITFDLLGNARPFHTYFDAGAYECHDPTASIEENKHMVLEPYPLPASNNLTIPIYENSNSFLVSIISLDGKIVSSTLYHNNDLVKSELILDLNNYKSGSYILEVKTDIISGRCAIIINK